MLEIPDHDVLLAGFPWSAIFNCRGFEKNASVELMGFRMKLREPGFLMLTDDPREAASAFLLENVKSCLYDKGRTFDVIHRTLQDDSGIRFTIVS